MIDYVALFTEHAHCAQYPQADTTRKALANAKQGRDLCGREPWEHFSLFKSIRKSRAHLLKPDERWLEPSDILQDGDAYLANGDEWWDFDGPHSSITLGQPIPLDCYCYTPKGKKLRTSR